jgi:ABC-type nitrate/sulfonate/bicarbonate transport system permease component
MFSGLYSLASRCEVCGTRFEREEGAWLGAVALGYGFGAFFGLTLAIVELAWHPIARAGLDPAWTIAIAALPVTLLAYRPAKALWFGLLYLFGFMGTP